MAANSQIDAEAREIIDPPDNLKDRILRTPGGDALDMSVVAKAETALEEISDEFPQWMESELVALRTLRDAVHTNGLSEDNKHEFFLHLHNVRGQAATLGFPLAGQIAGSLCEVIQHVPANDIPRDVIDNHVNAIVAIVNEKASGQGSEIARKLTARLCDVTKEYLDHMLTKHA
jgi:hypothetical protein